MRQHKTVKQPTKQLKAVICDKCGKVMKCDHGTYAGVELVVNAGYGSKFDVGLADPPTYDLCDECWGGIVGSFEVTNDRRRA